jgi:hypothetical protein
MMKFDWRSVACVAILGAAASAEGVVIVDAPGLGVLPDISTAIAAAAPGDVLLVAPGNYAPFVIDNKSLSIFAMPGGVTIDGTIEVRNLGVGKRVVLSGLEAHGAVLPTRSGSGLVLTSNVGQVRLQRCTFRGGAGMVGTCTDNGAGGHAVQATGSARALFSRCMIVGGRGYHNGGDGTYDCFGGDGGDGIHATGSALVLYDSTLIAGAGGDYSYAGGDGGHALSQLDFGVVAVNTRFEGGAGGDGWDFLYGEGGDGGDALRVEPSAQAQLLDDVFVPGPKGISTVFTPLYDGAVGAAIGGGGIVVQHVGPARTFKAPTIVSDRSQISVVVEGEPGDRAWLLQSSTPTWALPNPLNGVWLAGNPAVTGLYGAPITLDSNGLGAIVRRTGEVSSPNVGRIVYMQGLAAGTNPAMKAPASAFAVLVLDRAAAPDCDGNAVLDYLDLLEGSAEDCQSDFELDACQIALGASADCNANGVPDDCEIASGAVPDLNHNGVPDPCEVVSGGPNWYVDGSAAPGGNGSIAAPFETIWQGVIAAQNGHTIHIADGLYRGVGNRAIEFGGKNLTLRSMNGPANCVIDCESASRAFWIHGGETDVRLEGLTVRNGYELSGGGLSAANVRFTLTNCVFEKCTAWDGLGGGAVYANGGSATIEGCEFRANRCLHPGGSGGAIKMTITTNAPLTIRSTVFSNNTSPNSGGALLLVGQSPDVLVAACQFEQNVSTLSFGGAVSSLIGAGGPLPTPARFENCLFVGNRGWSAGGLYSNGPTDLSCCTFVGNTATTASGGAVNSFRPVTLSNCVLWGNSAPNGAQLSGSGSIAILRVERCDVQGGVADVFLAPGAQLNWGAGNLASDPLFVDADGPDNDALSYNDNDYRLASSSPCVDAGDNSWVFADVLDLDGDGDVLERTPYDLAGLGRFYDTPSAPNTGVGAPAIVDMGCFEQQP